MSVETGNRRASHPNLKTPVAPARFGGRVQAGPDLPIALNEGTWFLVEGNGTIERLPAANASAPIRLLFTGTVTLVHSTSLICQGYASLTVYPDDTVQCLPLGDGIWQVFVHRAIATLPPFFSPPTGRLSLSSTAAVPTSDITGSSAQTLYYIDGGAGYIPIWNSTLGVWTWRYFTGSLSLALDSNSGHTNYHAASSVFDVYAFWDATLGSLRLGTTGSAGDTFSQRGSNISDVVLKNGIWVNTLNGYLRVSTGNTVDVDYVLPGVNQATYLGAIGTVAAGQGEDSVARRLVFNAYNPKPRSTLKKYTGSTYTYNTQTYRQVAADATMQVETLSGLTGILHRAKAQHWAVVSAAPAAFNTAIGLNGTTAIAATEATFGFYSRAQDTSGGWGASFEWEGYAPLGRNVWKWLEYGSGVTTHTWQTNSDFFRNGVSVTALET
jgi:hypothetical protein